MKARLVEYALLMVFSVVMACIVGSSAAEQFGQISNVLTKAMQLQN
ncbi:hypothetical protein [Paraburkholderia sp. A3RO-2L]|jgi:hypothetical protein